MNGPYTENKMLFRPDPDFVKLPPHLPFIEDVELGTPMLFSTSENPGAIEPGHLLTYSSVDGKMETFQPEGTWPFSIVHPLTVRMKDSEQMDPVRRQEKTTYWLVVTASRETLALVPISRDGLDGLLIRHQSNESNK